MAFRGTEIMVIVRGQNYASQMLRRVSGDLGGVTSAAASANARLAATQAKIVSSVAQQAKLQKAVNDGPGKIAASRAVVTGNANARNLALQARQASLARREQTLLDGQKLRSTRLNDLQTKGPATIAAKQASAAEIAARNGLTIQNKRNAALEKEQGIRGRIGTKVGQIGTTESNIQKITTGSTYLNGQKQLAQLEERKLDLKKQQEALDQRAPTLQARQLRQLNQRDRLIRAGQGEDIGFQRNISTKRLQEYAGSPAAKGLKEIKGIGSEEQQSIARATLANRLDLQKTSQAMAALPAQQIADQEKLNASAATLAADESRIATSFGEQAGAVVRLNALLETQKGQLATLNGQLAGMSDEYAKIDADQAVFNAKNVEALAALDKEQATLARMTTTEADGLARIQTRLSDIEIEYRQIEAAQVASDALTNKQLLGIQAQVAEYEAAKAQLAEITAVIEVQLEKELAVNAALVKQGQLADRIAGVQRAGSLVSHVGRVAQFGGLVTTAALGATALNYAHFTSETTQAATQMANISGKGFGDVTVKAKQLQSVILDMMKQFPANAKEQADAAYNLFSSIPALNGPGGEQKGFALLSEANKAAVAGNTNLATSTSALIKVMNNFGDEGQSVNQIMNRMFAIVRFGNMHFADFDSMLNQIAPAAKGAGQTLNDLAGVIAEATIHMAPAQSATGLARLLQIFQRPQFTQGATKLGVQTTNAAGTQLLPIMDILDNFAKKYPALKQGGLALANLFKEVTAASGKGVGTQGTIQAQKLLNILITNLPELHKLQNETINDNAEFARSYAAMSQTAGVKWSIFMNLLRASAIQIGQTVIPVFERIGGHVKDMIDWFDKLSPHTRSIVGQFAAWGAVSALLGGTLLHLGGIIIKLAAPLLRIVGATGLISEGWVGLAIIAGIAVALIITHWSKVKLWWDAFNIALPAEWNGAMTAILGMAEATAGAVLTTFITLGNEVSNIFQSIGKSAGNEIDKILPGHAGRYIGGKLGTIADWTVNPVPKVPVTFKKFAEQLTASGAKLTAKGAKQAYEAWNKAYLQASQTASGANHPPEATTTKKNKQLSDAQKWAYLLDHPKAFAKYEAGLTDSSALQKQLNDLINQGSQNLTTLGNTAAQRADQVAAAEQKMQTKIQSVVQNLMTLFNNFQQVNEQTFGTMFGGPVTQGPIGQAYANLAQYNIAPPIKLLIQDQTQQANQFEAYRKQLTGLRKKGVPQAMIDELQSLGSAGRLDVQTLSAATKAQIAVVIKEWKRKKGDIQDATTIDYNKKLKEYESYGKQTMWAILTGMKSQTEWLSKGFTKYILTDTLGATFTKWVNQQFPNLVKNAGITAGKAFDTKKAREATAKASVTGKKTPTITTLPGGGKTTTVKPITLSEHQQALVEQAKLIIAGLKVAFTIAKATGNKALAKKDFQSILEHKAELNRLKQGKTAVPKGEYWDKKLGRWIHDSGLPPKNPISTDKPPHKSAGGRGDAVITKEIHHHTETTELHVHGQVGESLQAAGRRLLFEHQVGVRRRRAMKPGHP